MVPFNRPTRVPEELELVSQVLSGRSSEEQFNRECDRFLRDRLGVSYATLTPSCTHALELAALALEIGPGDEVIVPAFSFPSTANAFLLRGARLVFADIRPDTQNIDPALLAGLITGRTRAIVVVHYAGVACDMDAIMRIADAAGIPVVEDAAHALFGAHRGRPLGSIGAISALSFHRTKNFCCGEGGAFLTNDGRLADIAEIVREKGTNRSEFMRGLVHKYEWVREGSSYILADLLAAQLRAQLGQAQEIQAKRKTIFERYQAGLADWTAAHGVGGPKIPEGCEPAWHLYYLVMPSEQVRDRFLSHLRSHQVEAAFHYAPLHLTPMGRRLGGRPGDAPVTERIAACLVRLPFYTDLSEGDQEQVVNVVRAFDISPDEKTRSSSLPEEGSLV
ncbi:MAG: dTDP-4-amino-4,6-dideoxygalactose transaminase [Caulobacterales bacterium]|jgi:dTDP-4-amino-4,6-dideoxygalactose transaminase